MPFRGFEGPAGCGKTFQLIGAVADRLAADAPNDHQKALALTFMHGARRRLERELQQHPQLQGKSFASTIDSFARQVVMRWRCISGLTAEQVKEFDVACDRCGELLERPNVARWVARSYPIVMVDEAQELSAPRLRMVRALADHTRLFVAADEFQCLDEDLDTTPFMEWFSTGEITPLAQVHRTNQAGLLAAAVSLRQLTAPQAGAGLSIGSEFPNLAPFKIGAAIRNCQGTKAVLYPPAGTQWARQIADRLALGLYSANYNIAPIQLVQEVRADDDADTVMDIFAGVDAATLQEADNLLRQLQNGPPWLSQVQAALHHAHRKQGKLSWSRDAIHNLIKMKAAQFRAHARERKNGIPLLSIHQAKNRQFDHVLILWPHGVPGSADRQARLLYNGITRARVSCKVFVRANALLQQPPFRFA